MNIQDKENDDRDFSIELDSNQCWHSCPSNGGNESVLIEGTLGRLLRASFVELEILEVKGSRGVLRLYLRESEITVADSGITGMGGDKK
jgi:hypothetical protein